MVNEIEPSTKTPAEVQKRWRLAYFTVYFLNTISSSARKLLKKLKDDPISRIAAAPTERFSSISQTELTDLMNNKDLNTLNNKFNGVGGLAKSSCTLILDMYRLLTTISKVGKLHLVPILIKKCPQKGFGMKDNGAKDGWYEGISIFVAVFWNIVTSAVCNFRQEKKFHDLMSKTRYAIKMDAIRDGNRQKVSIFNIVVGDVIVLKIGDQVPADGLFINGHSLLIDESSMTGGSDCIAIDAINNPFLFSGSNVVDGSARMLVISVGMNTAWGKTMSSSITGDRCDEQTPIQSSLDKIASLFAKVGLAAVLLDLVITFGYRYSTGYTKDKHGNWDFKGHCTDTNDILNSFTRAVVATTEGLPLAVILTLAYCMTRMKLDQAMVRKLIACETVASVTVICTDKTGTLTLNQMKVKDFWVCLIRLMTVHSVIMQNPLKFTVKVSFENHRNKAGPCLYPHHIGMAASSLTCIAFAHKQNHNEDGATNISLDGEGLTLLGIVGIKDPCRPGAKEAIDACRSAGVGIKMITGDDVFTAKAIATDCGILEGGQQVSEVEVVEGEEFRNYTDEERMEKVDRIKVMARSTPSDKLLMVQCLKKKGHVVAVTGHATNDAHALKEADVGLSMGIQGTEVAKESSDIIILDDNFASVVMALMWGRCVRSNIQKFIQFQLTANVVALVINFVKAASCCDFTGSVGGISRITY
ncbi:calcium-transporting ATPase 12, plasma membrane-type-like protein [Tanacetum coccineum]